MRSEKMPNGSVQLTAESDADSAALDYVHTHVPLFAGMEPYGINAFAAGVEWGREHPTETS